VLKIGQEVSARVIKVDKTERRIGLSIKAADYTPEQLEREKENYEALSRSEAFRPFRDFISRVKVASRAAEHSESFLHDRISKLLSMEDHGYDG